MPTRNQSGGAAGVRQRAMFLRSLLAHPRRVGAILPTSRRAVRDTLDMASFDRARWVVEFGAGTGVYTGEVLARLRPDARFLAFELDPTLADGLSNRFQDPRLRIVNDSAENARAYLGGAEVDVIVSSVPYTSLPVEVRRNILRESVRMLAPGGVMLVLQYSPYIYRELRGLFASVRRRVSLLNVPPAYLFACREPRPLDGRGEL